MGIAQAGDPIAPQALLPLTLQNAYRARYRAMRPGGLSSGDQLEAMVRRHVAAGTGPDPASLAGHRAPGMPVIRGVGERLPFLNDSFDVIVCLWVLEHLKEPLTTLREVHRVLRPGARFIFVTPNLSN